MTAAEPVRVVIIDDHDLVREGLRGVLDSDPRITVVGEAPDGNLGLAAVAMHHPDVVIMDLQMPGMGGIEATRRIQSSRPGTGVLVLTMFDDDDSVYAAVQAGAKGYLLKGSRRDELRAAVMSVASGQAVFGPGVAARVLEQLVSPTSPDDGFPALTPREREVLELMVDGLSTAAIARRLEIADKTVRNTISSILTKLHATDRAAAVQRAREGGLGSRRLPRRRWLLFTDIVGSTRLAQQFGDAYGSVLAAHNDIVDSTIRSNQGVLFGSSGDARFAWFADGSAALRAAIQTHDKLRRHAFPAGAAVAVRIGIHAGLVIDQGSGLAGLALHETARITSAAAAGQVLISGEAVPGSVPPNLTLLDAGEHHLRDLDRPLRLFDARVG